MKSWVDTAAASKTWLIFAFHQVDHSNAQYGTTPEILRDLLAYIQTKNVSVKTVQEMVPHMNP
jgi:hypothetical protein